MWQPSLGCTTAIVGATQDVLTLPHGSPTHQVWLVLGSRCRKELSIGGSPGLSAVTQGQATSTLKAPSGVRPENKRETSDKAAHCGGCGYTCARRQLVRSCGVSITSMKAFPIGEGMDMGVSDPGRWSPS